MDKIDKIYYWIEGPLRHVTPRALSHLNNFLVHRFSPDPPMDSQPWRIADCPWFDLHEVVLSTQMPDVWYHEQNSSLSAVTPALSLRLCLSE